MDCACEPDMDDLKDLLHQSSNLQAMYAKQIYCIYLAF